MLLIITSGSSKDTRLDDDDDDSEIFVEKGERMRICAPDESKTMSSAASQNL